MTPLGGDRVVVTGRAVGPPLAERALAAVHRQSRDCAPPRGAGRVPLQLLHGARAVAAAGALPGVHLFAERALHTHDGRVGREVGLIDADGHAVVLYHL